MNMDYTIVNNIALRQTPTAQVSFCNGGWFECHPFERQQSNERYGEIY